MAKTTVDEMTEAYQRLNDVGRMLVVARLTSSVGRRGGHSTPDRRWW